MDLASFVSKWSASGAAERANKDSFLSALCDLLGVPRPDPTTGDAARDLYTFEPAQFLGIEIKPWAKEIAELVLWIGYLQWHHRTRGSVAPREPVLRDYKNIERRDAVLTDDGEETVLGEDGKPLKRWNGRTMKKHPVTGEDVPDETAQVVMLRPVNPRKAVWPEADFVVGNPPFIGNKRMRLVLGDGYVEALRAVHDDVPETSDHVMYWWNHAAELVRASKLRRFGLITTNSITQAFNRKVVQQHLQAKPALSLAFAIPDHPWVDTESGAAVRIAMTVGQAGEHWGRLMEVIAEGPTGDDEVEVELAARIGPIHADLHAGSGRSRSRLHGGQPCRLLPGLQAGGFRFSGRPRDSGRRGCPPSGVGCRPSRILGWRGCHEETG